MTLTYYGPLLGSERTATLKLLDKNKGFLEQLFAVLVGKQPRPLVPDPGVGPIPYPMYEVLLADGRSEVVVHQRHTPAGFARNSM